MHSAAIRIETLADDLSLAKIEYAFEMNTIRADHVACYIHEFQAVPRQN